MVKRSLDGSIALEWAPLKIILLTNKHEDITSQYWANISIWAFCWNVYQNISKSWLAAHIIKKKKQ